VIPERVSENRVKPKRGRPPLLSDDELALLRACFPNHTTRRSLEDVHYRCRAQGLVDDGSGRFLWLVDPEACMAGRRGGYKAAILTELGRIDDDNTLLDVAAQLCKSRPTAGEAVRLIRRLRTSRPGEAAAVGLAGAMARAIDDYRARYPGLTMQQVRGAIAIVGQATDVIDDAIEKTRRS